MNLPPYAQTNEAKNLLQTIIATHPQSSIDRDGIGGVGERFDGEAAAKLRRLWDKWFEAEFAKLDAVFAVTQVWDDDAAAEIANAERPDALIRRLLNEATALTETRSDPLRHVEGRAA